MYEQRNTSIDCLVKYGSLCSGGSLKQLDKWEDPSVG